MSFSIECDRCGKTYRVAERRIGKRVRCKVCSHIFRVLPPEEPADDLVEYSESGTPIYRHRPRRRRFDPTTGDNDAMEAISSHIEAHLGKISHVFHELVSDLVHVDVHVIEPTEERPYITLVTTGMSDLPMTVPAGAEHLRYAELLISLPKDWPLTQEALGDERHSWPIRWLKMLARLPHEYQTWLGHGHTVPNGDPAQPFSSSTALCCCLLLQPVLTPEEFPHLDLDDDKTILFYSLVPLYPEEMDHKLKHGTEALLERLAEHEVTELLNPHRVNVCKRTKS
jgi:predicted Zn finger-like uncharacterized protein